MQSRLTRKKHLLSTSRIGFGVGVLVILLVIIFNSFIGNLFSSLLSWVSHSNDALYENMPRSVLASRLKDAEDELARVRYQGLLYALEVEKNQELIESLRLPDSRVIERGRVFARPPQTHYDTLLVSIASGANLKVGDYAYVSGILIGEVSEVNTRQVKVTLYSSPGTLLDVRLGEPSAIVVMRGLGGGSFFLEVPKEVAVSKGDPILFSQSNASIGLVQKIIDEPEQTTYKVYAATPVATADMRIIEFTEGYVVSNE